MSIGIFTDKKHKPSAEEIRAAVGSKQAAWEDLSQFARQNYADQEELKFLYGKNYGWALRFLSRGKMVINLYPADGSFTAQINLPEFAVQKALGMDIGAHVRQVLETAHPYPEGRWLFIPVQTERDLADVKRLLALRVVTRLRA